MRPLKKKGHVSSDREGALMRMLKNDIRPAEGTGEPRGSEFKPRTNCLKIRIRSGMEQRTEDCSDASLIRVGRDQTSNIVLKSRYCSRRQFEIFAGNDGYYIRSLSRTNPTILIRSGRKRYLGDEAVLLKDRDQLRAADIRMEADIIWGDEERM